MIIRTKSKSNNAGRSQVIAIGGGKQRTVDVDLSKSSDWNHGTAAGTLLLAHNWTPEVLDDHTATHETNDAGGQHVFTLTHNLAEKG